MKAALTASALQWEIEPCSSFRAFRDRVRRRLDSTPDAEVVVFPEYLTLELLAGLPDWPNLAPRDFHKVGCFTDEYRALFSEEAICRGQMLIGGSHLVPSDVQPPGSVHNAVHVFAADGRTFEHHKTHRFSAEAEWGVVEGDRLEPIDCAGVRLGVMTCYEAEIPEVATTLVRAGAEFLVCPAYTFSDEGFWRVRYCCHARAIENQAYVAVAFLVGGPAASPLYQGRGSTAILTPCDQAFPAQGVAAEVVSSGDATVTATLDLELLRKNRRVGAAPTLRDRARRVDLYEAHGVVAPRAQSEVAPL